jgi:hypothetical protein
MDLGGNEYRAIGFDFVLLIKNNTSCSDMLNICSIGRYRYLCKNAVPEGVNNLILEVLADGLFLPGPHGPHHLPVPP